MSRLRTAAPAPGVARATAPVSTAPVSTAPVSTATPSGVHSLGRADAPAERFAERTAEAAATAHPLFADFSFAAVPPSSRSTPTTPHRPSSAGVGRGAGETVAVSLDGPGRAPDDGVRRAVEAVTGADLSGVRVHDDAAAQDTAARAGAAALTVGQHVAFAPGRHDPRTPDGRRRLAHELAHAARGERDVVRRDPPPGGAQAATPATTLAGLPEADRKRIQVVSTTAFSVPGLKSKFDKGTSINAPGGLTPEIDAAIPAALHHGLTNVAAEISNGSLTPPPLQPDTTVTLALDLTPYGGSAGSFRFTYVKPPPSGKSTPPARIVVEALGAAAQPAGTKAPVKEEGKPEPKDPIADKITAHSISQSYSGDELEALRAAISLVPDSHLAIVDGLRFARGSVHPTKPDVGGNYNPATHTITMFDKAFKATEVTFQDAGGAVRTSYATRAIVHEIGHAVDLAPLRTARNAQDKADAAVAGLAKKYPDGQGGYSYPRGGPEEKEVKAVEKAATDAEKARLDARSRSGTKDVKNVKKVKGKPDEISFDEMIGTAADSDFRKAVRADGKDVSKYAEEDWQESYAEAYSLYLTEPKTLQSLRPKTYAYLDDAKRLPK